MTRDDGWDDSQYDAFAFSNPHTVTTEVATRAMRPPRPRTPHDALNETFRRNR